MGVPLKPSAPAAWPSFQDLCRGPLTLVATRMTIPEGPGQRVVVAEGVVTRPNPLKSLGPVPVDRFYLNAPALGDAFLRQITKDLEANHG